VRLKPIFPENLYQSFSIWIVIAIVLPFFLRVIELLSILQQHLFFSQLIKYMVLGWGNDIITLSLFLLILFPFYWLLQRFTKMANALFLALFSLLTLIHILLVQYYAYMLIPLNEFFWVYFPSEMWFTVRSANVNYFFPVIYCIFGLATLWLCYFLLRKTKPKKQFLYIIYALFLCFILSYIYPYHFFSKTDEKQIPYSILKNKSHYFYKKTFKYFLGNKIDTEIDHETRAILFPQKIFFDNEYPLLSITNYEDVLSSYFHPADDNPNIVIIIVEGLGEHFMGKYKGIELMPFLNSLANKSLYWKNFVSPSERSFGALPSVLASTPYGEKGFVFLNQDTTSLSLMNLLSSHGYYSTFFYGQPDWFHNAGAYLRKNNTNRVEHAYTYPDKYKKIMVGDYFWGYNDQDLVSYALEVIESLPQTSRLDIIYTGSMHSPFIISEPEIYAKKFQNLITANVSDANDIAFFNQYEKYFITTLFADDALKNLFSGYEKSQNYKNTIFIITGDHGMSEIPQEHIFTQYHVPLLIYSPRLKSAETFLSVNSQLDIVPSILAFLQTQHKIPMPKTNAFIGKSLDTCKSFRSLQPIIMMNGERQIEPILYDRYLIINNKLYELDENLSPLSITNENLKNYILSLRQNFNALNNYTYLNNRLVPAEVYYQAVKEEIRKE